jgi:uncharacterized protein (DUF488 family)
VQHVNKQTIWTIGHSTRSEEDFLALLRASGISLLADIRHYPGSRRFPHFNSDALQGWLKEAGIRYVHFRDLGGRRKPLPGSVNTRWRLEAFRGYADYMETDAFRQSIEQLQQLALEEPTAYMCSEAVWWSCHRSLVSDYLKVRGWTVLHIMDVGKETEHPWTSAARIVDGALRYDEPGLF